MISIKTVITLLLVLNGLMVGMAYSAGTGIVSVEGSLSPLKIGPKVVQKMNRSLENDDFSCIVLAPISAGKLKAMAQDKSIPRKIGFGRNVSELLSVEATGRKLRWRKIAGQGQYAGLKITSPSAQSLRIGIKVKRLPEKAEFRFIRIQDGKDSAMRLVTGEEILDILALNKETDPDDVAGEYFWSPTIEGDTIAIEIFLPEKADLSSVQISLPLVSHITVPLSREINAGNSVQSYGDSAPCQNDVNCAAFLWRKVGKAVANMRFIKNGGSYTCTGTLLNDLDPDTYKPFFLTANHCISSQAVASSLETQWFFESSTCNGYTRSPFFSTTGGGAFLLHTKGTSWVTPSNNSMDITLLKLRRSPPERVYYSGWTTGSFGTSRIGIHHPKGDWKKISYASHVNNVSCYMINATDFNCLPGGGNFYKVKMTDGGTEKGSSGSALFLNNGQLIGTLKGTNGSCSGAFSYYSSFSAAYHAGNYAQWFGRPSIMSSILPLLLAKKDDAYEENDILLKSYNLSSKEMIWLQSIAGYGVQSDDDWYRIYVNSGYQRVIVELLFTHAQGDIDISLHDIYGNLLVSSTSMTDNERIDHTVSYGGPYYLKVYYANAGNRYNLRWDDTQ